MNKQPLVSVLLPAGRDRRFLKTAVESVKNQSYKSIELLVGEDKGGEGITKTLNKLTKKAKGEFLARMDADDISEPDRIEKQVKFLMSNPEVMLVGSWATLIDESGRKIGLQKMPVSWEEVKSHVFYRNPLIHPSWMMKKKWFLERNGYNEFYRLAQDWEFTSRWVWNYRMENIPETLIKLRLHPKSVSFRRNSHQVMANLFIQWQMLRKRRIEWWKAIILIKTIISWFFPAGIKFKLQKKLLITNTRSGTRYQQPLKTLGIVLPMGQSRKLLEESGQWSLWQKELSFYRKNFETVEFFGYRYSDWRRYFEALLMPIVSGSRFRHCCIIKAVHLTGVIPCLVSKLLYGTSYVLSYGYRYDKFAAVERKWGVWLLSKLLTPLAVKLADAVVVPTGALKAYVENFGARKIAVIPNGVDTKVFKGPTPPRRGRTLRILFVGRFEKQKNLITLIKATFEFDRGDSPPRRGVSSLELLFVGDGSQKQKLRNLANKLKVKLTIKSPVKNNLLPRIYNQADIFVLPSLVEGHPKALIEAMGCALPCLATNIAGVKEIIIEGKNGLLVEPTVGGISSGLKKLILDAELRERLGKAARATVVEKFDKKKLMEKEIKLLKRYE